MSNNLLHTAQDALCIKSVNLRSSNLSIRNGLDVEDIDKDHATPQSFGWVKRVREFEEDKNGDGIKIWQYKFNYEVGVRLVPDNEEKQSFEEDNYEALIHVMAEFQAVYDSKEKMIEEHLEAFSENNVGFNVWPYWRELVQSYCCRIAFHPPIEIPLYKSLIRKPEDKQLSNEE